MFSPMWGPPCSDARDGHPSATLLRNCSDICVPPSRNLHLVSTADTETEGYFWQMVSSHLAMGHNDHFSPCSKLAMRVENNPLFSSLSPGCLAVRVSVSFSWQQQIGRGTLTLLPSLRIKSRLPPSPVHSLYQSAGSSFCYP